VRLVEKDANSLLSGRYNRGSLVRSETAEAKIEGLIAQPWPRRRRKTCIELRGENKETSKRG